jgi:predicted lipid-binding transport protein (Tim44 family)
MKKFIAAFGVTVATFFALALPAPDAEAKRLGGGGSFGMQRSAPATPPAAAPAPKPAQQAAPATAGAAGAAQAAGKRSWLGPVAGLAAGLGLAALASHLGFGEEMASMMLILLLVVGAVVVFKLLTRGRTPQRELQYAGAGQSGAARFEALHPVAGSAIQKVGAGNTAAVPAGFDVEGFLRQAKLNFIRLQAANDRGDLDDIANFTTPEMFAEIKLQLAERSGAAQQTDVMQLDAALLEVVTEGNQHIASVRFHGLIREDASASPSNFDEIWHLAKPVDGGRGWQIAGIQQVA